MRSRITGYLSARRRRIPYGLVWLVFLLFISACSQIAPPGDSDSATPTLRILLPANTPTIEGERPTVTETETDVAVIPDPPTLLPVSPSPPQEFECQSPATPTLSQTEGPYYTQDTPERSSLLETGIVGERLVLTGYVLSTDCEPIPGAWLDFWQADGDGVYDNVGFQLRGHQFSDTSGRYILETVYPGRYPGRTAHIHVKVMAPGQPTLTTQIYFPGESQNETDGIFRPELLASLEQTETGWISSFNFYLEVP